MALVAQADVERWRAGARRFADGFTPGQKAVTLVAVAVMIAGGYFFMSFAGKPSYAPLFTNLQASDAAAITTKLTSDHVPYQLQNGGSSVYVPQNDVDQERINLASAGLPASSTNVGLGILDKEGITTSQATQQADYLQALQGELQSTIESIHGVTGAQVNLAMPATNTFSVGNANPTGASVLVDTANGAALSGGEVQAIVHLVASSVPGLSVSQVTVADSSGDLLAGPGVDTSTGSNNNATSAFEASQQAKIAAYLASVLGQGNSEIQVNALLDFNQTQTTTQGFQTDPKGTPITVPTQTQTSTETATGGASGGGVLGGATATGSSGGSGNYSSSSSSTSYSAGTVTQTQKTAPGAVQNQSIAVLVNQKSVPSGVSLNTLKQGVAAAAGVNLSRGDTLVMNEAPFSTATEAAASKAAAAAAAAQSKQSMSSMIRTGVLVLAIAVVLFLLWRSAKKSRVPRRTPMLMPTTTAQPIDYELAAMDTNTGQVPAILSERPAIPDRTAEVGKFIDSQPAEVAALLRAWTKERETTSAGHA
jgi:flagellar M-ring protein FliF